LREVVIGFNSKRRRAAWSLKVLIIAVLKIAPLALACGDATLRAQQRAPGFRLAATTSPRTHLEAENNEDVEALVE
jgi:hypothetical protein